MIAVGHGRWAENYPKHIKEAKRRGLTCGVGESRSTQTVSRTSEDSKFAGLSNQTVCRSATTQIGGKSLWKKRVYGQFPARPFVDEATRRGLTCGVGESGLSQVASTSYTPKPLEKSNWRPSEFEELVCELELAATGSYSKEDVISWLPQTSFHIWLTTRPIHFMEKEVTKNGMKRRP